MKRVSSFFLKRSFNLKDLRKHKFCQTFQLPRTQWTPSWHVNTKPSQRWQSPAINEWLQEKVENFPREREDKKKKAFTTAADGATGSSLVTHTDPSVWEMRRRDEAVHLCWKMVEPQEPQGVQIKPPAAPKENMWGLETRGWTQITRSWMSARATVTYRSSTQITKKTPKTHAKTSLDTHLWQTLSLPINTLKTWC